MGDLGKLFAALDQSTGGDITLEQFEAQYQAWKQAESERLLHREPDGGAVAADDEPDAAAAAAVDSPVVIAAKRPLEVPAGSQMLVAVQLPVLAAEDGGSSPRRRLHVRADGRTVECGGPSWRPERYTVDRLVGSSLSADELYAQLISAQVIALIKGTDGHVVFHGARDLGTPPMLLGPGGLVQLAGEQLFAALRRHGSQAGLRISCIELHGERAIDLLAGTAAERAEGRQEQGIVAAARRRGGADNRRAWWPTTAAAHACTDEDRLAALLRRGDSHRTTAQAMDENGAVRGPHVAHAAVRLTIQGKGRSSLTFYDLVPSPAHDELARLKLKRRAAAEAPGDGRRNAVRAQCMVQHRQGWLVLRRLLKRLGAADGAEPAQSVLPFRDSKLTLLLRPCVCPSQGSRLVVLGCCGRDIDTSRQTLQLCALWRKAVIVPAAGDRSSVDAEVDAAPKEQKLNLEVAPAAGRSAQGVDTAASARVFDKLTDPRLFTGSSKHRFDDDGRGKGVAGRDAAPNNAVAYRGGNVHDIAQVMRPEFHSPTRQTRVVSHARNEEETRAARSTTPPTVRDAVAVRDLQRMEGRSPRRQSSPSVSKASSTGSDAGSEIFDRLSDPRLYTGHHKHRFDENGRGKGVVGRDTAAKGAGNRSSPYRGGAVHDLAQIMRPGFHSPTRETRIISHTRAEDERSSVARSVSPRKVRDDTAESDLQRVEGRSPRRRESSDSAAEPTQRTAKIRRQSSRAVDLASVQARYRGIYDAGEARESSSAIPSPRVSSPLAAPRTALRSEPVLEPEPEPEPELEPEPERADNGLPAVLELADENAAEALAAEEEAAHAQAWSVRMEAVIASKRAAEPKSYSREKRAEPATDENIEQLDSPLPPDLESPGQSVLLDQSLQEHEQSAPTETKPWQSPAKDGQKPWHESPAVESLPPKGHAGGNGEATIPTSVAVADLDSDESVSSEEVDGIDSELWYRAVTTALAFRGFRQGVDASRRESREAEHARLREQQILKAVETRATQAEAQVTDLRAALAAEAEALAQASAELHETKAARDRAFHRLRQQEVGADARADEHKLVLEQLAEAKAQRDEAVQQLQAIEGERSTFEQETKRLASELNQLREDWFASWEAEQHLASSSSSSSSSSSVLPTPPAEQARRDDRSRSVQDVSVSSSSQAPDISADSSESYLRYLKVEKGHSDLDATVDLSWWQPTAEEEEKRRKRRADALPATSTVAAAAATPNVLPLPHLQAEWEKARAAQEELQEMQKKVDARRTRLRRQLAQHGVAAVGETGRKPRKYVVDDIDDDDDDDDDQ